MTEIIIDSFAGGGGASLGIERALHRSPDGRDLTEEQAEAHATRAWNKRKAASGGEAL